MRNDWVVRSGLRFLKGTVRSIPSLVVIEVVFFICSCIFVLNFFTKKNVEISELESINSLVNKVSKELERYNAARFRLNSLLEMKENVFPDIPIPILVIACNRPTVNRPLDKLINLKKNAVFTNASRFPIFVSHACENSQTTNVLNKYGDQITILKPSVPLVNITGPKTVRNKVRAGYIHVAHHYKWALDQMFLKRNYRAVIIVEDDLDLAPDFLEYFAATFPLLNKDPTLFCVSAFNDNGRLELIDPTRRELLYRTDFFPGLGWMLLRRFWMEIRSNWPDIFWDEYLRKPWVRKGRSCLRPEISRSVTFGRIGISQGQYFDTHLKYIYLNEHEVPFLLQNLTYLQENYYKRNWHRLVYENAVEVDVVSFLGNTSSRSSKHSIRVTYHDRQEFEKIAKHIHIMSDFKGGVCRNAYQGVVPIMWSGGRVFISPPATWTGYNTSWV